MTRKKSISSEFHLTESSDEKKFEFSEANLTKAENKTGKRLVLFDNRRPGLALRISPSGAKTFAYMAWDPKRKKSVDVTIGSYPKVLLKKAREIAQELSSDLTGGVDLAGRKQDDRDEPSLDQAFQRWIKKKAQRGKTSWTIDVQRFNKHISPQFGQRRVGDITTRQIENWFLSLPEKTGLSTTSANRLLVIIRTVFNQELKRYLNPCDGITLNREDSRDRFLKPAELPLFFQALESQETPDYLRDFVYLGLYTGARKANLLSMKWTDIDFDLETWTISARDYKNRQTTMLPLMPAVIEILTRRWEENQERSTPSTFVFPSINPKGKTGHMTDIRDSWESMLERAGIDNFRVHDLRRTIGSWQTITGSSTAIVGKSLGHKSQQATAVYARMHLDPVRKSLEKAIGAMEAARNLPEKITPLRKKNQAG